MKITDKTVMELGGCPYDTGFYGFAHTYGLRQIEKRLVSTPRELISYLMDIAYEKGVDKGEQIAKQKIKEKLGLNT